MKKKKKVKKTPKDKKLKMDLKNLRSWENETIAEQTNWGGQYRPVKKKKKTKKKKK